MFELTGALTYILPTMIVLLVTKAVGDFLGTRGIADEMIRFNGFPFLDKEDHAFNVSVSSVMRKELYTLSASGMTVHDVESILGSTNVNGFPIIASDDNRIIIGYIGSTELRYVLDRSRKLDTLSPDTLCSFAPDSEAHHDSRLSDLATGPALDVDDGLSTALFAGTGIDDRILFWPWVNRTPLTVSSQLPLEIVMQLFKRMGPRVILVEDYGALVGLVTVKDVLRFTAIGKPESEPSWDERGGLDGMLEEIWSWAVRVLQRATWWSRRVPSQNSGRN